VKRLTSALFLLVASLCVGHNGIHHQERKEISRGRLPFSVPKQDQDDAQRGKGERLHGLQGLPPACLVQFTAAIYRGRESEGHGMGLPVYWEAR
jgi:hypothetical protein